MSKYEELSKERKELITQGLVPEWYITPGYQMFVSRYEYETNGRSVRAQFERIAKTAATHLPEDVKDEGYDWFFKMLWNGWLSPSTPVLANMGTTRGMPVSCAGNVVEDSISGFYSALAECASLSKFGFGTASYLGNIRPRGSKISVGGKANGVLPVIKMFVQMTRDVSQGSTRRGAWAGYLPIDHDDFDEVIDYINAEPDDVNIGWCVSDEFIKKLNHGEPEASRRFERAMKTKMVSGRGYFFFPDKTNRHVPEMYKKHGLTVKSPQLCVAPETQILTRSGYQTISELENEYIDVWNGSEWSNVQIKKTGENQELVKVKTNSGFELECTPYHKFYIHIRDNSLGSKVVEKRAHELKAGDKLIKLVTPVIEGDLELPFAYENGFFSADGCFYEGKSIIYLYEQKRKLRFLFPNFSRHTIQENQDREVLIYEGLQDKYFVPDSSYTVKARIDWFSGYLDGDGCLTNNNGTQSLQIASIQEGFLKQIQTMLQTLGIQSKVIFHREAGEYMLPANDGTGGNKLFNCQPVWRLLITATGIIKLLDLGLSTHRVKPAYSVPNRECSQFIKVTDVEWTGRKDDTYCFTEPKKHLGVFNGLLTGNCNEITLFSDEQHTYSCVLSSMNLATYDEWKDTDAVYWATIFLDCVCEEFLTKARHIEGLEKIVRCTEKGRALGLGVCGLHTYMQDHMIVFESLDAQFKMCEMFELMQKESKRASQWMAATLGEPEWCKGFGVRNTHTLTCPPTKSTSLLMAGVSEGINVNPSNTYTQNTASGNIDRINASLVKVMKERGVFNRDEISKIVDDGGSVRNVEWLNEHEKAVFRTGFEMNQNVLLRYAAIRNRYVDQWQSVNLFVPSDTPEEVIAELHEDAFNDENIEGLYYIYTTSGFSHQSKIQCESCQ